MRLLPWVFLAPLFAGAESLPIEQRKLTRHDSVSGHHRIYDAGKNTEAGQEVKLIGAYDQKSGMVYLQDPPWLMMTWKQPVSGKPRMQQTFSVKVIEGGSPDWKDKQVLRLTGKVQPNRPDLNYQERQKKKLHHFNMQAASAETIAVKLDKKAAVALFHRELPKLQDPVAAFCKEMDTEMVYHNLPTPRTSGEMHWYGGYQAVTHLVSPAPPFSFKPIPYVLGTLLIEPETGKPVKLILSRQFHRDPHI